METLPNEILLHIFNFAIDNDDIDTYINIILTCRWFNEVSKMHDFYAMIGGIIRNKGRYVVMRQLLYNLSNYENMVHIKTFVMKKIINIPYMDINTIIFKPSDESYFIEVKNNKYWPHLKMHLCDGAYSHGIDECVTDVIYDYKYIAIHPDATIASMHEFVTYVTTHCKQHDNITNSIKKLLEVIREISSYSARIILCDNILRRK